MKPLFAGALALVLTACAQTPEVTKVQWAMLDAAVQTMQQNGVELVNAEEDTLATIREGCIVGAFGTGFAANAFEPTDEKLALVLAQAPEHLKGACKVALTVLTPQDDG